MRDSWLGFTIREPLMEWKWSKWTTGNNMLVNHKPKLGKSCHFVYQNQNCRKTTKPWNNRKIAKPFEMRNRRSWLRMPSSRPASIAPAPAAAGEPGPRQWREHCRSLQLSLPLQALVWKRLLDTAFACGCPQLSTSAGSLFCTGLYARARKLVVFEQCSYVHERLHRAAMLANACEWLVLVNSAHCVRQRFMNEFSWTFVRMLVKRVHEWCSACSWTVQACCFHTALWPMFVNNVHDHVCEQFVNAACERMFMNIVHILHSSITHIC